MDKTILWTRCFGACGLALGQNRVAPVQENLPRWSKHLLHPLLTTLGAILRFRTLVAGTPGLKCCCATSNRGLIVAGEAILRFP